MIRLKKELKFITYCMSQCFIIFTMTIMGGIIFVYMYVCVREGGGEDRQTEEKDRQRQKNRLTSQQEDRQTNRQMDEDRWTTH